MDSIFFHGAKSYALSKFNTNISGKFLFFLFLFWPKCQNVYDISDFSALKKYYKIEPWLEAYTITVSYHKNTYTKF